MNLPLFINVSSPIRPGGDIAMENALSWCVPGMGPSAQSSGKAREWGWRLMIRGQENSPNLAMLSIYPTIIYIYIDR